MGPSNAWRAEVQASGGEMGRLVSQFDWSASPLGAFESWPQSLRTSVSICLSSRFPIVLWWGPDLVMIYNDAYRPMLGASKHPQALGAPGRAIWPEIWHVIGPMLEGVMAGQGATWSDDQQLPLDRNGFVEECYFTFSYSPIVEESGAIGGVFCAVTETTEKIVGARRLETLGALAAQLVDSPSAHEVCLRTTKVLADNGQDVVFAEIFVPQPGGGFGRAAGFGAPAGRRPWPLEQVASTGLGVVVPLDPHQVAAAAPGAPAAYVVPVYEPGESQPCAVLVVGLSERRPFDAGYRSFLDLVAGHAGTAFGGATSFERQRQRAQALAELDAAKTTFFSNISHELRTPLTLITGPVDDALNDTERPLAPVHRDRLALVARNAARLRRLVNGMLDFAQIEAGRLVPERVPVDLSRATSDLAANFSDVMARAGLTFTVEVDRLPRPVPVDRDMWDRIVLNLLSNALKYTLDGEVTLSLRDRGDEVELRVVDTGMGIPAGEVPRLFDRFHRVTGARGRSHEGSGIGLALVAELLKLLGGTIAVESTPGRGSVFTVRLPYGPATGGGVSAVPATASEETAALFVQEAMSWHDPADGTPAGPTARATDRPVLLIAEDNRDLGGYLTGLLEDQYHVVVARDGRQAWETISTRRPDLLLTDVMMPGLDGFALLAAVRADPVLRDLPVVLLSARAGEEAAADGFAAGADDYLVKPFSAHELRTRLRAALSRARARTRDAAWRAAMIRSLHDGVFIADSTGTVVEVNDAFGQITGWGPEGLPYPAPHPWWPDMVEAGDGHEVPLRHRDGGLIWVAVAISAIPDQHGGDGMLVGTVRDVTRERDLRRRRDAAARLVAALAADLTVAELQAAALHGFAEVFTGQVGIAQADPWPPATVITTEGTQPWADVGPAALPADAAAQPGLLVDVPSDPACRIWVRFPAPRTVPADERILAATLADALAGGLSRAAHQANRDQAELNLRQAIDSHRFIGQAVGILMERHRLTAAAAFDRLRQASRDRNLKLRAIAEHVIMTGEDPAGQPSSGQPSSGRPPAGRPRNSSR